MMMGSSVLCSGSFEILRYPSFLGYMLLIEWLPDPRKGVTISDSHRRLLTRIHEDVNCERRGPVLIEHDTPSKVNTLALRG